MVAWLPVQGQMFFGEESAGSPAMGPQPGGPAPGRKPWDEGWFCSQGGKPRLPSVLGSTGWNRFPGASPGLFARFVCLACLLVLNGCAPLITSFGAGGCWWWLWLLIPHSPIPYPPVDRCGHTRVPPKSLGVVRVRSAQGSEAKICVPSYAGYPSSPYRCSKRFDM